MRKYSIGNDIVDLKYEEPVLHSRFESRVFGVSELSRLQTDRNKLWRFWSAKEAAYKALKRLDFRLIFSPIKFECNEELNCITFEEHKVSCHNIITSEYSYTVCATSPALLSSGDLYNWIDELDSSNSHEALCLSASKAVRTLAISKISAVLNTPAHGIEISLMPQSNNKFGTIPILIINKRQSKSLLSFSHHGRFVACAFLSKEQSMHRFNA